MSGHVAHASIACEYYHNEALEFLRAHDWEFAHLRSDAAVSYIEEHKLPRWTKYGDCESWLRMVRMISAIHLFDDEEARKRASVDAEWLTLKSKVSGYDEMVNAVLLPGETVVNVRNEVRRCWEAYDLSTQRDVILERDDED